MAPDGRVDIRSYTIDDFDYDKGGRTAAEYLQWRFDRMITDIMHAMATDFDAFMGKFGGSQGKEKLKGPVTAVGKLLQKLTVKQLGRLFWFRVDPSIGDRRVADVGVELVRNIFMGNEPYVPGTPMYDALDHLLRRLSPVLHILEKKLSAGNPQLSELRSRMLSRRSRREDLQARLSSLHEAALKLRERLGNPLADAAETGRYAAALMRDADRFSADLGK